MRLSRQKINRIRKQNNQSRKKSRQIDMATSKKGIRKLSSPRNRHRNIRYGSLKARKSHLKGGAMLMDLPTTWDAVRTSITNLLQEGALKSVESKARALLAEPFNNPNDVGAAFYSFANDQSYKPLLQLVWGNDKVRIKAFRYLVNLGVPTQVSSILDPLRIELRNTINTGGSELSDTVKRQKYLVICFYRKLINLIIEDLENTQQTFGATIADATFYRSAEKLFLPKEIAVADRLINTALNNAIQKGKTSILQSSQWLDSNIKNLRTVFPNIETECDGIIDMVGEREVTIPDTLKEAVCDMGEMRDTSYCVSSEQPPAVLSADDALSLLKKVPEVKKGATLQEQLASRVPEDIVSVSRPESPLMKSEAPASGDIDSDLFGESMVGKEAAAEAQKEAARVAPIQPAPKVAASETPIQPAPKVAASETPIQPAPKVAASEAPIQPEQQDASSKFRNLLKGFQSYLHETMPILGNLKDKLGVVVQENDKEAYQQLVSQSGQILFQYYNKLKQIADVLPSLNQNERRNKQVLINNLVQSVENIGLKAKENIDSARTKLDLNTPLPSALEETPDIVNVPEAPKLSPSVEKILNQRPISSEVSTPSPKLTFAQRLKAFGNRFTRKNKQSKTASSQTRKAKPVQSMESQWLSDEAQRESKITRDTQTTSGFLQPDVPSPAESKWMSDTQKRQAELREAMAKQLQAEAGESVAASKEVKKSKSSFDAANPLGIGLGLGSKMPSLKSLFGKKEKPADSSSAQTVTLVRDALGDLKNIEQQLALLTQEVKSNKKALSGRLSGSTENLGGDVQASLSADKDDNFNSITIKVRYPKDGASTITPNTGSSAAQAMTELVRHIDMTGKTQEEGVSNDEEAVTKSEESNTAPMAEEPIESDKPQVTASPAIDEPESAESVKPEAPVDKPASTDEPELPSTSTFVPSPSSAQTETEAQLAEASTELDKSASEIESAKRNPESTASKASTVVSS
jgi:hypothetical protein